LISHGAKVRFNQGLRIISYMTIFLHADAEV